jgi:hypothetical protein
MGPPRPLASSSISVPDEPGAYPQKGTQPREVFSALSNPGICGPRFEGYSGVERRNLLAPVDLITPALNSARD